MHTSLTKKTNLALCALWLAIAVLASFISPVPLWAPCALGSVLGLAAGVLQLRALYDSASSLVLATNALEVRRALRSSWAGRLYIYFLWLSILTIMAFAAFWFRGTDGVPSGMIIGAAAFAFVREGMSVPGAVHLEKMSERKS
jgi:hypothetical protein